MRILVMLLLDTLPMLGNVLLLCFFVFFIFGIVGVQLWAGMLRQRCFIDLPKNITAVPPGWVAFSSPLSLSLSFCLFLFLPLSLLVYPSVSRMGSYSCLLSSVAFTVLKCLSVSLAYILSPEWVVVSFPQFLLLSRCLCFLVTIQDGWLWLSPFPFLHLFSYLSASDSLCQPLFQGSVVWTLVHILLFCVVIFSLCIVECSCYSYLLVVVSVA